MSAPAQPISKLIAVVEQVLAERGPLDPEALAAALTERRLDLGPDPEEVLDEILEDDDSLFMPLADDRWCHLPSLLRDRVFTHRLTAAELEHDLLAVSPDLEPALMVTDDYKFQPLSDGTPLRVSTDNTRSTSRSNGPYPPRRSMSMGP